MFFLNLKVMMGGAWYEKYIGDKDERGIYDLAFGEIKKHLSLKVQPDHYHLSVLKVALNFVYIYSNRI
jgi:hypothetical protein